MSSYSPSFQVLNPILDAVKMHQKFVNVSFTQTQSIHSNVHPGVLSSSGSAVSMSVGAKIVLLFSEFLVLWCTCRVGIITQGEMEDSGTTNVKPSMPASDGVWSRRWQRRRRKRMGTGRAGGDHRPAEVNFANSHF